MPAVPEKPMPSSYDRGSTDLRGAVFNGPAFGEHNEQHNYSARPAENAAPAKPPDRQVFVVRGRDDQAADAVYAFLRDLDLRPLDWESVAAATGKAAPHVLEVVRQGFADARAVLVLLTPDDFAILHGSLRARDDNPYESKPTGQARANVLFEAGMAMALHPDRTVFVQFGEVRPFTDVGGLDFVRIDGSAEKLNTIATRLERAGCRCDRTGNWLRTERFAELDALRRQW
jgi:predicted nucleotide-binding protein